MVDQTDSGYAGEVKEEGENMQFGGLEESEVVEDLQAEEMPDEELRAQSVEEEVGDGV